MQLREQGAEADLFAVCSLEGTHGGLALGAKVLGTPRRVIAWRPYLREDEETRRHLAALTNTAAEWLGLEERLSAEELDNRGDAVGPEYGLPTPEAMEALHLAARTEGLLLDPVYTAKALAGVRAAIRAGEVAADSTVVFVHTGGNPALFAYAHDLARAGDYAVRYVDRLDRGVL